MIINRKNGVNRLDTYETIDALIPYDVKALISNFSPSKDLVYTSFDGDYMFYLNFMLNYVLEKECIPVNPESSLGYYVSTSTHKGEKIPVMIDCINLELLCDKMWVFNPVKSHISEGVLAEIMIWAEKKRTSILMIDSFPTQFPLHIDINSIICEEKTHEECLSYIDSRNEEEKREIHTKLLDSLKLPPTGYIIANIRNIKHIDWAREYCYKHNITPICPHTIIPCVQYYSDHSSHEEYLLDRLTLLKRAKYVFLFANYFKFEDELSRLDSYSLCELLYAMKYLKKDVFLVGWDEASVPKYLNNEWALTSVETREVF